LTHSLIFGKVGVAETPTFPGFVPDSTGPRFGGFSVSRGRCSFQNKLTTRRITSRAAQVSVKIWWASRGVAQNLVESCALAGRHAAEIQSAGFVVLVRRVDVCGGFGFRLPVIGTSKGSRHGCEGALIASCFGRGGVSVMLQGSASDRGQCQKSQMICRVKGGPMFNGEKGRAVKPARCLL